MQATALFGLGLPVERLATIAAASGRALTKRCNEMTGMTVDAIALGEDGYALILDSMVEFDRLEAALHLGVTACIEAGNLDDQTLAAVVERAGACNLFISVTTVSAYRLPLASALAGAIRRICGRLAQRCDDIELALQEAISNAVIHGNLDLAGLQSATLEALDLFSSRMEVRLADPILAARRVEVLLRIKDNALIIDVTDQGKGFHHQPRVAMGEASGRGINLITSLSDGVELLDHGRRTRMRFGPCP